jgi:hypothetical protein
MTDEARNTSTAPETTGRGRRPWTRPTLTAYGPIGKLTQGKSGTKNDGTSGSKGCL